MDYSLLNKEPLKCYIKYAYLHIYIWIQAKTMLPTPLTPVLPRTRAELLFKTNFLLAIQILGTRTLAIALESEQSFCICSLCIL